MSAARPSQTSTRAALFAALGDETRLALLHRLSGGQQCSIAELTQSSSLTRQAITKHLRTLEGAQIVRCVRRGRESLFEMDPRPLAQAGDYLARLSAQWDQALQSLKAFVESEPPE